MLQAKDFTEAIHTLGIQNACVEVHSSFRAFGRRVDSGADTVLDAFTSEGCSVLVFAYTTGQFELPPPDGFQQRHPARNAWGDYAHFASESHPNPRVYTPGCTDIMRADLGLIPYTLVNRPGRARGRHPLNSFAAIGPCAEELVREQTPEDVFAPLRKLCELDGYLLLMGVGLNRATLLHYAENVAGRAPFLRWAKDENGMTIPCRIGSCSGGFPRLDEIAAPIERRVTVGDSLWRCFPARELVALCAAAIRANPDITRCGNPACARCDDAIAGGPAAM